MELFHLPDPAVEHVAVPKIRKGKSVLVWVRVRMWKNGIRNQRGDGRRRRSLIRAGPGRFWISFAAGTAAKRTTDGSCVTQFWTLIYWDRTGFT